MAFGQALMTGVSPGYALNVIGFDAQNGLAESEKDFESALRRGKINVVNYRLPLVPREPTETLRLARDSVNRDVQMPE